MRNTSETPSLITSCDPYPSNYFAFLFLSAQQQDRVRTVFEILLSSSSDKLPLSIHHRNQSCNHRLEIVSHRSINTAQDEKTKKKNQSQKSEIKNQNITHRNLLQSTESLHLHGCCNRHGLGSLLRCCGGACRQPCRHEWYGRRTYATLIPSRIPHSLNKIITYSWLFKAFMAASASSSAAKRTKPNPRLRKESRSLTTICRELVKVSNG